MVVSRMLDIDPVRRICSFSKIRKSKVIAISWIMVLDFAEYQAGELAYQEGYTNSDFYESNGISLC